MYIKEGIHPLFSAFKSVEEVNNFTDSLMEECKDVGEVIRGGNFQTRVAFDISNMVSSDVMQELWPGEADVMQLLENEVLGVVNSLTRSLITGGQCAVSRFEHRLGEVKRFVLPLALAGQQARIAFLSEVIKVPRIAQLMAVKAKYPLVSFKQFCITGSRLLFTGFSHSLERCDVLDPFFVGLHQSSFLHLVTWVGLCAQRAQSLLTSKHSSLTQSRHT